MPGLKRRERERERERESRRTRRREMRLLKQRCKPLRRRKKFKKLTQTVISSREAHKRQAITSRR
jgi:hypothetical protein